MLQQRQDYNKLKVKLFKLLINNKKNPSAFNSTEDIRDVKFYITSAG